MNQVRVGVGIMLLKDNKILLGHRVSRPVDTGGYLQPDSWCLPGGKQEFGETIYQAAYREVKEETGIEICDARIFGLADDIQPDRHFLTVHVLSEEFAGTATVMEKDKQDCWKWFDLSQLPENIYEPSRKFIDRFLAEQKNEKKHQSTD